MATSPFLKTANISTTKITKTSSLQDICTEKPPVTRSSYFRLAPVELSSRRSQPTALGHRPTSARPGECLSTEKSTWMTFTPSWAQSCHQAATTAILDFLIQQPRVSNFNILFQSFHGVDTCHVCLVCLIAKLFPHYFDTNSKCCSEQAQDILGLHQILLDGTIQGPPRVE